MMSILRSGLFLALGMFAAGAQAQPFNCKAHAAKLSSESGAAVRCFCGSELDNLTVTLPQGMKVNAVCGLKDPRGAAIDLEQQKVSLDKADKKSYPSGTVYLAGAIALDGVVTVNPSDAGEMWFVAKPPASTSEFVIRHLASNIKLGSDEHYRSFNAPKQALLSPECFNAPASITASDLEVGIAAGGKGGTVARKIDVRKVKRFQRCDPNSQRLVAP